MSQIVTATFEGGMFKPDVPPELPPHARVRLIVEWLEDAREARDREAAWEELEKMWDEETLESGERPTRDQLNDRGWEP